MKYVQLAFPGGKNRAFTMSYDDGVLQDKRLVQMMNAHGVKGTFNLNSGFFGIEEKALIDNMKTDISKLTKEEAKELYEGHEIATHGLTHLKFTDIDTAVVAYQIIKDRENLEDLTGGIITGLAYPFGVYDKEVISALKTCGITYARTVQSTGNFALPEDFMEWHPTCHHNDGNIMELAKRFCLEPTFFYIPRLFYVWGHSYEFDQRDNWEQVQQLLEYVSCYKEEIWFATNGEIYEYIQNFKRLVYSVDGQRVCNPTSCPVWAAIDDKIWEIPSGATITLDRKGE